MLGLLFHRPEERFYLRQIIREVGCGQGAVQRELHRLAAAGILGRTRQGNQVHFQVNADCPIFGELRGIVLKTTVLAEVPALSLSKDLS